MYSPWRLRGKQTLRCAKHHQFPTRVLRNSLLIPWSLQMLLWLRLDVPVAFPGRDSPHLVPLQRTSGLKNQKRRPRMERRGKQQWEGSSRSPVGGGEPQKRSTWRLWPSRHRKWSLLKLPRYKKKTTSTTHLFFPEVDFYLFIYFNLNMQLMLLLCLLCRTPPNIWYTSILF